MATLAHPAGKIGLSPPCDSAALTTVARMPVHPALLTVTVMGALVAVPPPASVAVLSIV